MALGGRDGGREGGREGCHGSLKDYLQKSRTQLCKQSNGKCAKLHPTWKIMAMSKILKIIHHMLLLAISKFISKDYMKPFNIKNSGDLITAI